MENKYQVYNAHNGMVVGSGHKTFDDAKTYAERQAEQYHQRYVICELVTVVVIEPPQ